MWLLAWLLVCLVHTWYLSFDFWEIHVCIFIFLNKQHLRANAHGEMARTKKAARKALASESMSPNSVKRRKNTHLQGEKRVSDDHAAPNFVNTFVQHINTLLRRSPPGNTAGLQAKAKEEGVTDLFFAVLAMRGDFMPKKKLPNERDPSSTTRCAARPLC